MRPSSIHPGDLEQLVEAAEHATHHFVAYVVYLETTLTLEKEQLVSESFQFH